MLQHSTNNAWRKELIISDTYKYTLFHMIKSILDIDLQVHVAGQQFFTRKRNCYFICSVFLYLFLS
jgi:hypothetical protein